MVLQKFKWWLNSISPALDTIWQECYGDVGLPSAYWGKLNKTTLILTPNIIFQFIWGRYSVTWCSQVRKEWSFIYLFFQVFDLFSEVESTIPEKLNLFEGGDRCLLISKLK